MTAKGFQTKPMGPSDQVDATRRVEREMRDTADSAIDSQSGRKSGKEPAAK